VIALVRVGSGVSSTSGSAMGGVGRFGGIHTCYRSLVPHIPPPELVTVVLTIGNVHHRISCYTGG